MSAVALVLASFAAMEVVSYATHRFVMHGVGMAWHRSHHRPPTGRLERNDLFPLCFAAVGVGAFALATTGPRLAPLTWVATGVTAYGALYLFVHEVYVHRRLPVPARRLPYLEWLRESHGLHHRFGGEPYGMLLPVVPAALRARARRPGPADGRADGQASPVDALDRRSTRASRSRL